MNDSEARAIGNLEGKIDLMLAEQDRAAQSRKSTYEKLEALAKKLDAHEVKLDTIDKRLKAVEEPVAEFSRWRERGVGAIMLVSLAAASVGGLVATFGKKIWVAVAGS